jgi:hypothetical protein
MPSTRPTAVLERLIDDDYLHEQVAAGASRLRRAYVRARRLPNRQAVQDERLYDHVRVAAGALTEATRRALGKPKPQPKPKRRVRKLLLLGAAGGAAVLVAKRRERDTDEPPPAAARPPATPVTTAA